MPHPEAMHVEDTRVASFDAVRPKGKKRNSNVKSKKGEFLWTLQSPSIQELAQAGFYYAPRDTSQDNVTCFHCHMSLDQWEEGDNAVKEHLAVVPTCAYAIVTALEHNAIDLDDDHDPLSERFLEARKATFGTSWPFENEKGWVPKAQKLAEAGWHYFPQTGSEDYTKCAYCALCLDGWEPKDKPLDEHKRRSPNCRFFELTARHKRTRAKKSRASKASRSSMQSTTNTTQDDSELEVSAQPDDSILTTATDVTTASAAANETKKSTRAKKSTAKAGSRSTRAKKAELSEFDIDPSADPAEEEEAAPLVKTQKARGKKRSTADMQADGLEESIAPPAKKRATKARVSATESTVEMQDLAADKSALEAGSAEIMVPKRGAKKRGTAGSRTTLRTASGTRKASSRNVSTTHATSAAYTRKPALDEGEIEAMLEADLDQAADEEEMSDIPAEVVASPKPEPEPKPKAKRQPRAKAGKKATSKSAARDPSPVNEDQLSMHEESLHAQPPTDIADLQAREGIVIHEDSVISSNQDLFVNHYENMVTYGSDNDEDMIDELAAGGEIKAPQQPAKAKPKTKTTTDKTAPASKKGKQGKAVKAETSAREAEFNAPEEELDILTQPEIEESKQDQTELRCSSSFEHEPSILDEAEVPAELVEHFSPKKKAQPAQQTKSRKAAKVSKSTTEPKKTQATINTQKTDVKPVRVAEKLAEDMEIEPAIVEETNQPPSPSPVRLAAQRIPQPRAMSPVRQTPGGFPSPTPSPQSSNAENEPPSSRPLQKRPPLAPLTPSQLTTNTTRVPLVTEAVTPTRSTRKENPDDDVNPEWALKSDFPWRPVDLETVFHGPPELQQKKWLGPAIADQENALFSTRGKLSVSNILTSPEKRMTMEEWIEFNAQKCEAKLKADCEQIVSKFESIGVAGMKAVEGMETHN